MYILDVSDARILTISNVIFILYKENIFNVFALVLVVEYGTDATNAIRFRSLVDNV